MIIMIKIIILSEGSQTGKDKCPTILLTCGTLKNDTNALIYKTEIDSQAQKTSLWLPKGKGGGGINQRLRLTDTHCYT